MKLPEEILSILACPICKHRLQASGTAFSCCNQECAARFPIVEGRPVLLNEKASVFRSKDYSAAESSEMPQKPISTIRRFIVRLIPSLTANWVGHKNYAKLTSLLRERSSRSTVLIVGGGELGAGIQPLISENIRLVETDVRLTPRTVLVADGHDLPFLDESFDAVVIQAVLEHVLDPYRCVAEIHRVLKAGGVVYAESPFMYPVHMGSYDFMRFSLSAHRRLFRNFAEISSGAGAGPGQALALSISSFVRSFSISSFVVKGFATVVLPFLIFWLKYFDYFIASKPHASDFASTVFFLGTKAQEPIPDKDIIMSHWSNKGKAGIQGGLLIGS
jgi:uncharacterized protein YbaR (Trm112 family)/SAM-dependent methyltransferase